MSNNKHNDDLVPLSNELAQILLMVTRSSQRLDAIEDARKVPRCFTVQQAAVQAGISRATMYRVIEAGGISVIRDRPGGRMKITEAALMTWLERGCACSEPLAS